MDVSLSNHIKDLNDLSYKDKYEYIVKKLISTEPDDISHLTFLKKLQITLIDLPNSINNFIKDLSIGSEGKYTYCFNTKVLHNYFSHKSVDHIKIYCRRILKNEYLVTVPIKNNFKFITTNIKINENKKSKVYK